MSIDPPLKEFPATIWWWMRLRLDIALCKDRELRQIVRLAAALPVVPFSSLVWIASRPLADSLAECGAGQSQAAGMLRVAASQGLPPEQFHQLSSALSDVQLSVADSIWVGGADVGVLGSDLDFALRAMTLLLDEHDGYDSVTAAAQVLAGIALAESCVSDARAIDKVLERHKVAVASMRVGCPAWEHGLRASESARWRKDILEDACDIPSSKSVKKETVKRMLRRAFSMGWTRDELASELGIDREAIASVMTGQPGAASAFKGWPRRRLRSLAKRLPEQLIEPIPDAMTRWLQVSGWVQQNYARRQAAAR